MPNVMYPFILKYIDFRELIFVYNVYFHSKYCINS